MIRHRVCNVQCAVYCTCVHMHPFSVRSGMMNILYVHRIQWNIMKSLIRYQHIRLSMFGISIMAIVVWLCVYRIFIDTEMGNSKFSN